MKTSTLSTRRFRLQNLGQQESQPWVGWALAITAIVSFSANAPLGRAVILFGLSPTYLLIIRYIFSVTIGVISFAFTDRSILKIGWQNSWRIILVGIGSFSTTFTFYWAISYVNVSLATMLVSLYSLFVLIPLAFVGEKSFTPRNILRLLMGFGGLYFLLGPGGDINLTGLLFLIACILSYAIYLLLVQRMVRGYHSRAIAFYTDITMLVLLLTAGQLEGIEYSLPPMRILFLIFAMGAFGTYLARNLTFQAIKRIGSGQYSLLGPLDSVLTIIWSILFLQETLTSVQWIGGLLILGSAAFAIEVKPSFMSRFWHLVRHSHTVTEE